MELNFEELFSGEYRSMLLSKAKPKSVYLSNDITS